MSENQTGNDAPDPGRAGDVAASAAEQRNPASPARPVGVAALEVPAPLGDMPAIRGSALDAVKVCLSVEVGRIDLPLREVRATKRGGVINLDRMIGEALDIRINGRLIARGEIVATEGQKYGIRVTEMVTDDRQDDED